MKAKILIMAALIFGSSLAFSQTTVKSQKTDCEKKVLNKIKRNLMTSGFVDHMEEGEKETFIITCALNSDNIVSVVRIEGTDAEVQEAILKSLEKHPIKCDPENAKGEFTFKLTFEKRPV